MQEDDKEPIKKTIKAEPKPSQIEPEETVIDNAAFTIRSVMMDFCRLKIPQLEREERIDLYDSILSGSKHEFDFVFLMIIATSIASIGLAQNNTAVIIGAMLVAPLMTPILGVGLSLVQGNKELVVYSSLSTISGFAIALVVSYLIGIYAVPSNITPEMQSRGNPQASDLFIGLFSGMAAAYCKSRTHLSSAIPGVAIAAALVPPITTVGLSFAHGDYNLSVNSAALFIVNAISIIVGASLMFFAVGMRGRMPDKGHDMWVYIIYLANLCAFFLVLAYFIYFRHK